MAGSGETWNDAVDTFGPVAIGAICTIRPMELDAAAGSPSPVSPLSAPLLETPLGRNGYGIRGPNRAHGARQVPMLGRGDEPAPRDLVVVTIAPGMFAVAARPIGSGYR